MEIKENGYVYVARLIDYGGNFLGDFHKIGKTKHYKVRETQLNSTHLPIDILLVRVFETDNMDALEGLLHTCFEDYRIKKEYVDRRNITTEWFDVDDTDTINNRIDKFLKFIPNINEIDVVSKINSDKDTPLDVKGDLVDVVRKSKSVLHLSHKGEDLTTKFAADTFCIGLRKIADVIGWDKLDNEEDYVTKDLNELRVKYSGSFKDTAVREIDGYWIWTGLPNQEKLRVLLKHIRLNNVPDMECHLYP
jgi:hypothetical protein